MTPEIEQIIFNDFRNLLPEFPSGKFYKSESPDFIVESLHGIIGVELTEIFQDSHKGYSKFKQRSSDRHSFTLKLIEKLQPIVEFTFHINIHFSDFNHLSKFKNDETLNNLFNLCINPLINLKNQKQFVIEDFRHLPEEVNSIRIGRFDGLDESFDEMPDGGTVANLTDLHLNSVLEKKNVKIDTYQECKEYWLLIREGNYYAGSFREIQITKPVNSKFDKVYLFRTKNQEIIKLK